MSAISAGANGSINEPINNSKGCGGVMRVAPVGLYSEGDGEAGERYDLIGAEAAAITHDIACPLCREKYRNTNGKYQEAEGATLVRDFLSDAGMSEEQLDRVAYLVGHHHTFSDIDGADYQILVEADYIANATENGYGSRNIENFINRVMKTRSGIQILRSIFRT
jgi:hypothetical protein